MFTIYVIWRDKIIRCCLKSELDRDGTGLKWYNAVSSDRTNDPVPKGRKYNNNCNKNNHDGNHDGAKNNNNNNNL